MRRSMASLLASVVCLGVVALPSASAAPVDSSVPTAGSLAAEGRPGPTFTLLTGDVVRMNTAPDGSPAGEVVHDAGWPGDVVFKTVGGDLYALTGEAVRLIGLGKLDMELFNLTRLAEYGYDDASVDTLPVITTHDEGATARRAAPAVPDGASRGQTLDSIGAQALAVEKDEAEQVWADLTETGSGVETVWLDAKLEVALDVSVPAVGAPAAWEAGYDGAGVTVAVLDTGIDVDHADFAGRIMATESFIPGEPVRDFNGHGTHVASIAAGSGAAEDGRYRGVAPGAQLVIGKVCGVTVGGCPTSAIIAGMEWATQEHGADVVNMSLGGAPSSGTDPLSRAVNQISEDTGALIVIAAGNHGRPVAMVVASPGAADRALTVGNVAKTPPHALRSSSSIGPRLGDYAVKPEITAPGTDIVAARAAGTDWGSGVGEHYQIGTGTSMATPHVAGAAALLAQRHPNWSGQELKDGLVSTAAPQPDTPLTWQGGGMLDAGQAVTGPLVATGTLNLGLVAPPYPATSGTITLRNTSDAPVHADLVVSDLVQADEERYHLSPYTPPDGAVTVAPAAVDIPAGGTATAQLTVQVADQIDLASYYGRIEARGDGGGVLTRTTVSWSKDVERHQLTVRGIDRTGAPAHTTCCSIIDMLNLETGEVSLGWWEDGAVGFLDVGFDPLLPAGGRYALLGNISDWTPQPPFSRLSETILGDLELVMDRDIALTFDAREGERVTYNTSRPSEPKYDLGTKISVQRAVESPEFGDTRLIGAGDPSVAEIYLLPMGEASTGETNVRVEALLAAPDLTMTALGGGRRLDLRPRYPFDGPIFGLPGSCSLRECLVPFGSPGSYEVVDAGHGTPGELAASGVQGKLVLVHEPPGDFNTPSFPEAWLDPLVAAAAAAGAAGILVAVFDPGPPHRLVREEVAIPVAVVPHADGEQLAEMVRGRGTTRIRAGGDWVSPYHYRLRYDDDHLPVDTAFDITDDDVATVTRRYHADAPGAECGELTAPAVRTEYWQAGVTWGADAGDKAGNILGTTCGGLTEFALVPRTFTGGGKAVVDHMNVPMYPGAVPGSPALTARIGVGFICNPPSCETVPVGVLDFRPRVFRSGLGDTSFDQPNILRTDIETRLRYLRDGQVLCEHTRLRVCTVDDRQAGRYRIELDATQEFRPHSSPATTTAWEFDTHFPDPESEERLPLPMIDVGYDVPVSMTNTVRAGSTYQIGIITGYQNGYDGDGPITVQAWVSHDDGGSWTDLGERPSGSNGRANFRIHAPHEAEWVTIRVRARDEAGNSVDQTITRAWRATS